MASTQEQEKLKQILSNPDQYKESSKAYKKGVQIRDTQKMTLITETIQKIIVKKHKEVPIMQLSAVRLVKECFELFVQEFIDMVAEKILPIMSHIAHFQQTNTSINRGKEYFFQENQEKNATLEQLGNSFFRLVLECIYVWAKWYPGTQYANTYTNLVEQKIVFPTQFTYFKPELINSTVDEIIQRREEASRIRREQKQGQSHIEGSGINIDVSGIRPNTDSHQQQSNANINSSSNKPSSNQNRMTDNQFQETKTGGGPHQQDNMDANPHVQVNNAIYNIQQVKNTLLEGLSKPKEMDQNLLDYFKQEFEKFSQNAQFYSQEILERNEEGNEDLVGKLFNETEFSELFIKNCNEYLLGKKTWTDLQKVFQGHMKKPVQKFGEASQTIGEYDSIRMQPNMLVSDLSQVNNMVGKSHKNDVPTSNNHFNHQADEEEPEETIKRNTEFTEDNKKFNYLSNNGNKNAYKSIAEDIEERKDPHDHHMQQLQPQNYNQNQPDRREEFANYDGGRRTLREALNKNEYEKYKCQLKSKTNFSKISSQNQSNLSNYSTSQKKPQFSKYSTYRDSSNLNNTGFNEKSNLQNESPEELYARLQETLEHLKIAQEERDNYKNRYESSQSEVTRLNQIIQKYQNNNDY